MNSHVMKSSPGIGGARNEKVLYVVFSSVAAKGLDQAHPVGRVTIEGHISALFCGEIR
jgi:hypothetical protein